MSIKLKIFILTISLLTLASLTVFVINRQAFISDKNSYIYTTLMDRMQFESQKIRSEAAVSLEKIRNSLLMIDHQTEQFSGDIRSSLNKENWGRLTLFKKFETYQVIDSIGMNLPQRPEDLHTIRQLRDRQVFTQYDITSKTLKTYYKQGNYAVLAESLAAPISTLLSEGGNGARNTYTQAVEMPKNYPQIDVSFIETLKGQNYVVQELQLSGSDYFVAYTEIPEVSLSLFQIVDKKSLYEVVTQITNRTLLASLIIIFIGIAFSALIVGTLTKNISLLSEKMTLFATQGQGSPLPVKSKDEIGQMTSVFNTMMVKINNLLQQAAEKARMANELATAKEVQETLLPKNKFENDFLLLKGLYHPASECGGDLWYYHTQDDRIFVFMGDATGHGVSAALITSATRTVLSVCMSQNIWSPAKVLEMINSALCDIAKGEKMMTAFAFVYDIQTHSLTYSNASHEAPFIVPKNTGSKLSKSSLKFLLEAGGKRLGESKTTQFREATTTLHKEELLFLYTDGLTDAINKEGKAFGERALVKISLEVGSKNNHRNLTDIMQKRVMEFADQAEQPDDITFASLYIR